MDDLIRDKELLRFATAGSVDDGKSTLIGRLLYDSNVIYEDQLEAVRQTSFRKGAHRIDLSLLTDGLSSEREQGITIDVAYRYFSTKKRRFIIADVPGHEQYTANMVTGVSTADLVIILVDATKGLLLQSKRHLFITTLLQVPHILIAINKMDSVNYSQEVFEKIKNSFVDFSEKLNIGDLQFIPISALEGAMIVRRDKMEWYGGYTLIQYLENLHVASDRNLIDFRFPVQMVLRPHSHFRGYAGRVEGGVIRQGDEVVILPSGKKTKIKSIMTYEGEEKYAFNLQSVVLTLEDELDISRGDMIVRQNNLPERKREFCAIIFWMSEEVLNKNRSYTIKHTTHVTNCYFTELSYKINVDNLHREQAQILNFNEVGMVHIKTHEPLMFDAYTKNRNTGSFVIIDEFTDNTIGAGIILDRAV